MGNTTLIDPWKRYTGEDFRRSSRVERNLPILVSGQDNGGQEFLEKTASIDLSLHGCGYPSRHDCQIGSNVTLRFVGPGAEGKEKVVRAQVRRVQIPTNSRNLYRIGVELDIPGNVWSVSPVPADWQRFLSTTVPAEETSPEPAHTTAPNVLELPARPTESVLEGPMNSLEAALAAVRAASLARTSAEDHETRSEQVIPAGLVDAVRPELSKKWVEDAVEAALRGRLEEEFARARSTFEEQTRVCTEQLQGVIARERAALVHASRDEVLARLENRLDEVRARWDEQLDGFRARTEEMVERMEQQARVAQQNLAAARELAEKSLQSFQQRMEDKISEAAERGAQLFEQKAAQAADRHLVRLGENAQGVTREATSLVTASSAAARAELQTAVREIVDEFRRQTEVHAGLVATDTTERVSSTLAALDAQHRTVCEGRQRAIEQEVNQAGTRVTEEFQQSLRTFFYSCLVAAVGAVEQHSKITLNGLTPEQKKPTLPES